MDTSSRSAADLGGAPELLGERFRLLVESLDDYAVFMIDLAGTITTLARTFENLIGWLGRDNSFPTGAFLLTGTGIVPDSNFTLAPGDLVEIKIDGIGTLLNPVVQG
jgi:2-dehydro-3-deoxy-D-arabinonate dehydratase